MLGLAYVLGQERERKRINKNKQTRKFVKEKTEREKERERERERENMKTYREKSSVATREKRDSLANTG